MTSRRAMQAVLLAILLGLIAPSAFAAGQHVVLGLSWTAQAEHCGFYQALEDGEYRKRGLDVVIQQGGPEVNNGLLLAGGNIDFALSDSLSLLRLRAGKLPVVAVAAYFQKDPQTVVAHPGQGITSLADLKGHPMLIAIAQRDGFWRWMKAKYGLDDSQLRPYAFSAAPFIADPASVQQGYITNDGYVLGKSVPGAKSLLLADFGYPNYSNLLITMDHTQQTKPDVVQALVDGSIAGWRSCIAGNFAAARVDVLRDAPKTPADLFDYSMHEIIDRGLAGPLDQVGTMTADRWAEMYRQMLAVGVLPADLDVKSAYTRQFLPLEIGKKP